MTTRFLDRIMLGAKTPEGKIIAVLLTICLSLMTWNVASLSFAADGDEEVTYTVTYYYQTNDEEVEQTTEGLASGASTPAPPTIPARTNWLFTGWDPDPADDAYATVTDNYYFYATWAEDKNNNDIPDSTEDKVEVSFVAGNDNGYSGFFTWPIETVVRAYAPECPSDVTGYTDSSDGTEYTFAGWDYEMVDLENDTTVSGHVDDPTTLMLLGPCVFTTTWQKVSSGSEDPENPNTYYIEYEDGLNGEVFTTEIFVSVAEGSPTPACTRSLVREGYVFTGWDPEFSETVANDVTYIAQWAEDANGNNVPDSEDRFKVVYDLNGGQASIEDSATGTYQAVPGPVEYTDLAINDATPIINQPAKDGTTFTGWSPYINSTIDAADAKGSTDKLTITYVAQWEGEEPARVPASVTYDLNGGEQVEGNQYIFTDGYYVGDTTPTIADPTRDGYAFAGWAPEVTDTIENESVTYTAQWVVDVNGNGVADNEDMFTVVYDLDGGATTSEVTEFEGLAIGAITPTIADPTKEGFAFAGWDPEVFPMVDVQDAAPGSAIITYTAQWAVDENHNNVPDEDEVFTVVYDLQGGVSATQTSWPNLHVGENIPTIGSPEKTGYAFYGWNPSPEDATVSAAAADNTNTITFVAQWGVEAYAINYVDELEAPMPVDNPSSYTIEDGDITLVPLEKEGYGFLGWYADADFTQPVEGVAIPSGSTGVKTFYAKWAEDSYSITYDFAGGALPEDASNPTSYSSADTFTLANPEREGYTFLGWSGTGIEGIADSVTVQAGSMGAREYTANWAIDTYAISYNLYEGALPSDTANPTSYTVESDAITLVNPERAGYTFLGWTGTDLAAPTTVVTIPAGSTGDRSYEASWDAAQYTITYNLDGGRIAQGSNPDSYTVEDVDFALVNPVRDGYTFLGWTGTGLDAASTNVFVNTERAENLEFTATWEVTSNTVSFNMNGGDATAAPADQVVEYGAKATEPEAPRRDNYNFLGWYTGLVNEYDGSVSLADDPFNFETEAITEDITLYAAWEPVTYTVTFDMNGVTAEELTSIWPDPVDVLQGRTVYGDVEQAFTPEAAGRTFLGWYDGPGADAALYDFTKPINADEIVYAHWSFLTYNVTYDLADGSMPAGVSNPATYTYDDPEIQLANPVRTGYTFAGWTGTGLDQATVNATIPARSTGDRAYTATWTPNTYYIAFNANGGTGDMANQAFTYNKSQELVENSFTNDGYEFQGWDTDPAGSTIVYEDGQEITTNLATDAGAVVTLYAVWNAVSLGITYDLAGGALPEGATNPTSYKVTDDDFTLANPTREGYEFAGWTGTGLSEATIDVTIAKGSTGARAYTATWTPVAYGVTYDLAGGEVAEGANPATYTAEDAFTLVNPTRTGYDFAGWMGTGLDDASMNVTVAKGTMGELAYAATWTPITYTIGYQLAGGSMPEGAHNPSTYTVESADITLANPVREGYDFAGWTGADLDEATDEVVIATGSTGNRTYTATWTAQKRTLTFVDADDPSTVFGTVEVDYDTAASVEDAPTAAKEGHDFARWNANEAGTQQFDFTQSIKVNTTVYATWTLQQRTVTFESNGGSAVNAQTVDYGAAVNQPSNPRLTGYDFGGWFSDEALTKAYDFSSGVTEDITLYAKWNAQPRTVTFESNGGSAVEAKTVDYNTAVSAPEAPQKQGYTFAGWYADSALTEAYDFSAGVTEDIKLYAKWNANAGVAYTVQYYRQNLAGDAYELAPEYTEYLEGSTGASVFAPVKLLSGFAQNGSMSTVSGTVAPDGSTVLRVYYDRLSFSVSYAYTGGVPSGATALPATATYKYGEAVSVAPAATAEGYTFSGWSVSEDFTMPARNVVINGNFTANGNTPYTVEYYLQTLDLSGYELQADATENLTGATDTTATALVKTFNGFTRNANAEGAVGSAPIAADGSTVLSVYYDRNMYTVSVTFAYADGRQAAEPFSATVPYGGSFGHDGDAVQVTIPAIEGYTPNYTSIESGEGGVTANMPLTVIYTQNAPAPVPDNGGNGGNGENGNGENGGNGESGDNGNGGNADNGNGGENGTPAGGGDGTDNGGAAATGDGADDGAAAGDDAATEGAADDGAATDGAAAAPAPAAGATTNAANSRAVVTIDDNGNATVQTIGDDENALASGLDSAMEKGAVPGSWSIVDILATILSVVLAAVALAGVAGRKEEDGVSGRTRALSIATLVPAIAAVVMTLTTQDFTQPVALVDGWSATFCATTVANIALAAAAHVSAAKDGGSSDSGSGFIPASL